MVVGARRAAATGAPAARCLGKLSIISMASTHEPRAAPRRCQAATVLAYPRRRHCDKKDVTITLTVISVALIDGSYEVTGSIGVGPS